MRDPSVTMWAEAMSSNEDVLADTADHMERNRHADGGVRPLSTLVGALGRVSTLEGERYLLISIAANALTRARKIDSGEIS